MNKFYYNKIEILYDQTATYIYASVSMCVCMMVISKAGDISRGWIEGSLFNSYNTEV